MQRAAERPRLRARGPRRLREGEAILPQSPGSGQSAVAASPSPRQQASGWRLGAGLGVAAGRRPRPPTPRAELIEILCAPLLRAATAAEAETSGCQRVLPVANTYPLARLVGESTLFIFSHLCLGAGVEFQEGVRHGYILHR